MNKYRFRLEAEKAHLLSILNNTRKHLLPDDRACGVNRVREIIDELKAMDQSQEPGDTRGRIVLKDIQSIRKVLKSQ